MEGIEAEVATNPLQAPAPVTPRRGAGALTLLGLLKLALHAVSFCMLTALCMCCASNAVYTAAIRVLSEDSRAAAVPREHMLSFGVVLFLYFVRRADRAPRGIGRRLSSERLMGDAAAAAAAAA